MTEIWQLLNMIWPILAGVALIAFCFFSRNMLDRAITFQLPLFNIVLLSRQLTVWLIRLLLFACGIALMVFPIFRDYSTFFPQRIKIEVYFDDGGLSSTLVALTPNTIKALDMSDDWRGAKEAYFAALNADLKKENIPFQFPPDMSTVHGIGRGAIKFRKISWGIQEYRVERANGNITLTVLLPGSSTRSQLETAYDLLDTNSNFVTVSLRQMYWDHEIVVQPVFQQIIALSQGKKLFHHTLTGVTRISILPPKYQPTIYFARGQDGKSFPIGYAIYEPDTD
jgi:hypothetical protein